MLYTNILLFIPVSITFFPEISMKEIPLHQNDKEHQGFNLPLKENLDTPKAQVPDNTLHANHLFKIKSVDKNLSLNRKAHRIS